MHTTCRAPAIHVYPALRPELSVCPAHNREPTRGMMRRIGTTPFVLRGTSPWLIQIVEPYDVSRFDVSRARSGQRYSLLIDRRRTPLGFRRVANAHRCTRDSPFLKFAASCTIISVGAALLARLIARVWTWDLLGSFRVSGMEPVGPSISDDAFDAINSRHLTG